MPTLIVEILSPSDRQRQVSRKVEAYTTAGVPLVWVMNPDLELLTVIEPGKPAHAYNVLATVPKHPALPGFSPAVKNLFS